MTPRHHIDEVCWVADCESCDVPMVVWGRHGDAPRQDERGHMLDRLREVAVEQWGADGFYIDEQMRQIPDHFHAHARRAWWT